MGLFKISDSKAPPEFIEGRGWGLLFIQLCQ